MANDLSLAGSYSGLRIANPDNSSPNLSPQSTNLATPPSVMSTLPNPISQSVSPAASPSPLSREISGPVSPLEPTLSTTPPLPSQPSPSSTRPQDSYTQRNRSRQSLAHSYQDQQQAQFPQYPTMMPQNLHNPQSNAVRPVSSFHTQPPTSTTSASGIAREGSYRRADTSRSPNSTAITRSDSRGGSAALQAGVPVQDSSHSDRTYDRNHVQAQYASGNGPVPPRRTSRGMGGGRVGAPASTGTTPSAGTTPPSGSPYGAENGLPTSSEEWKERGAAPVLIKDIDANGQPVSRYIKKGVKDFIFGQTLGEGSYSTVLAATDRQTLKEYAIKVLDKRHIIKEKKVKYVNIEKDTLNRLTDHPGVVRLYYTFQDERSLYFVLDLAAGGELLGVLKRMTTFDEECTRFYGAQILDTIDYMHRRGVIHRDLKPENVLLDDKMHVKITDFGTAKILQLPKRSDDDLSSSFLPSDTSGTEDNRASSFVGTAEYVSPELLTDKNACKASDLWAFGCIIYQLLSGRPPFKAGNEYQTFQKIVALEYEFPTGFPEVARDLVERLLVLDPSRRLSIEHIKNHEFFEGITWGRGLWQQKAPRLKAYVPPQREPIRLNGASNGDSFPPNIGPSHSTTAALIPPNPSSRPSPRVITELPPPSQLDIEWSPVLTRNNERILKLGNLMVLSSPAPHSPNSKNGHSGEGGKFSRFFGGSTTKKRQRLVMVTSSARIILAAAGGDEKKSKSEINLLAPGCQCRSSTDAKGCATWVVDTKDKHFVFEEPKPASSDPSATTLSSQEWLESLDRAREIAFSQGVNNSYTENDFNGSSAGLSSHANTLDQSSEFQQDGPSTGHRGTLTKNHSGADAESIKGRKRFSKRQSKSGLAAVF